MRTIKKLYWIAQFCGWTVYSSLIYLSAYIDRPEKITYKLLIQLIFMTILSISFTHLMRLFILKSKWLDLKLKPLIPRIVFISIVCASFIETGLLISEYFVLKLSETNTIELGRIVVNVLALTLLIICWNGIYFTYHFFQKSRIQEIENLSLESSKNEIELKNLRSQLNPHFLFNSLNSIRALIDLEPKKAKTAVTTLSNLLRKSLLSGKENLISINEEIDIVKSYLDLEKIRFEERLTVIWEIDEQINSFLVPPFSIQTLVENAIKHGVSKSVEGGFIKISTKKEATHIQIQIENSGKINGKTDTGIGIENTQRRLAIQYKDSAKFTLEQLDNSVLSTLTFNYEKA